MRLVNIVFLLAVIGAVEVGICATAMKSSRSVVDSYNKRFPYETRVDHKTVAGKAIHWYSDGHAVTVTPRRVNCSYITNAVDAAVISNKRIKKAQKAAKHDEKNINKAIKELKKLRDKSSDAVQPLYDEAIRIFDEAKEVSK